MVIPNILMKFNNFEFLKYLWTLKPAAWKVLTIHIRILHDSLKLFCDIARQLNCNDAPFTNRWKSIEFPIPTFIWLTH